MTNKSLICGAQKMVAAAAGALFIGSLLVIPAQAQTKQTIKKMDSTVSMTESGAAAMTILGGKADLNLGGASARNGATQDIGEMKSNIVMNKSGAAAMTILGGEASANIGGATVK
jgi:hypothetical protein